MINRQLYQDLLKWKNSNKRKPLILRGARQVGKTTLVSQFAKEYEQFLYFNLERINDLEIFNNWRDLENLVKLMMISRGFENLQNKSTLIFIDEIQEKPELIGMLRYFYEDYPYLNIIVTGSLLDFALESLDKVPVGRVSYLELTPISFSEYVYTLKSKPALDQLSQIPLPENMLGLYFDLFHEYCLIGGMPEILNEYLQTKNLISTLKLFDDIIQSYKTDVEKYADRRQERDVIRFIMDKAAYSIDNRITFSKFGNSLYKARELSNAFAKLEKAKLLRLIYPTTQTIPPILEDTNKSPRLYFLDIGLINYQLNIFPELLQLTDLNDASRGKLVQQIVYQELLSNSKYIKNNLTFWVRENSNSNAEVDLVFRYKNKLIPIEIKSGKSGKLRSLHEYMDRCPHNLAMRLYKGPIQIDQLKTTKGKSYYLLNLPYFLANWIEEYLNWFELDISLIKTK